ncbi:family A G protein-coupled receptor-like protein [Thozetella sp. PMI_491]|nr:family A G protein-coupled receptor-like protein [Thozetella sp. PMI_491]
MTTAQANASLGSYEGLSDAGSDWLWAVTAIYLVSFIGLLVLCFTSRESDRVFHYLFTIDLLVGAASYFAQASSTGWTASADHVVFFARYLNWAVSFPSVALALGLLSGVSWTTIITNISIALLWVCTYLAAAYTNTVYKWGFFAFGTLSWAILAMSTLNESREAAAPRGIGRDYLRLAVWANIIWLLYPIAFALSDGAHRISVTGSSIFFGILDILLLPLFSLGFMFVARSWDYSALRLAFSEYRYPVAEVSC